MTTAASTSKGDKGDIAWMQWLYVGSAVLGGIAIGVWVVAPMLTKKKAKKPDTPAKS
jgi:hypothetical protein